jgi:hypothetical protein
MTDTVIENGLKLYSNRAITIATYFGGPIAAGILVRRNFINLGKTKYGRYSLYIGIISTILLFIGIYSIPEGIIDKIPNAIIPLSYTAVIWAIVKKLQGEDLKKHKENNGNFYSAWKAAGVGAISMSVILICLISIIFISSGGTQAVSIAIKMDQFAKDEEKALEVFPMLEAGNEEQAHSFIILKGIPIWKSYLKFFNDLDKNGQLDNEKKIAIKKVIEYCQLRIESYNLIAKSIEEKTTAYDNRIDEINIRINELLK